MLAFGFLYHPRYLRACFQMLCSDKRPEFISCVCETGHRKPGGLKQQHRVLTAPGRKLNSRCEWGGSPWRPGEGAVSPAPGGCPNPAAPRGSGIARSALQPLPPSSPALLCASDPPPSLINTPDLGFGALPHLALSHRESPRYTCKELSQTKSHSQVPGGYMFWAEGHHSTPYRVTGLPQTPQGGLPCDFGSAHLVSDMRTLVALSRGPRKPKQKGCWPSVNSVGSWSSLWPPPLGNEGLPT